MSTTLDKLTIEFSGGCELLFGKQLSLTLNSKVPTGSTLSDLVKYLRDNCLQERPEAFLDTSGQALRPGVLCLVNDTDAEVCGGESYIMESGDTVAFISTLHGG